VHPLVLLSNLVAATGGGELTLERLTEWLAQRTGSRYLRIDPTRVDVAAVTALVSHAYARRHRFLPLAVDAERVLVATSEPLVQEWRRDLQHLTRRRIELAVVNPLDLHRYTMEFYGVTRSVRGARGDVRGEASTTLPSFEQLVELGRTGDVNADDQHIVHIVDWLLQYASNSASDIHLNRAARWGGALPHRRRAAQGLRGATGGDDRRGQPHQGARPHGPGRTPAPAGRPHQDPLAGRPRGRDAPVDHAHRLRRSA
jgi:general secretion pathway protein E